MRLSREYHRTWPCVEVTQTDFREEGNSRMFRDAVLSPGKARSFGSGH